MKSATLKHPNDWSRDGRFLIYDDHTAQKEDLWIVPDHVPAAGIGKWRISAAGGAKPRWRRDGKELYYIASDRKMMAVPVKSTATTFEPGVAVPLFETRTKGYLPYAAAPDGRFLINTEMEAAANTSPITVVLNWTAGLKK